MIELRIETTKEEHYVIYLLSEMFDLSESREMAG